MAADAEEPRTLLARGVAAHARSDFATALQHLDRAIAAALPSSAGLPLTDYGLIEPSEDAIEALLAQATCARPLLAALLTRRAATALRQGLVLRALVDTGTAQKLAHPRGHCRQRATGNLSSPSGIITKRELPVWSDSGDLLVVAQNVERLWMGSVPGAYLRRTRSTRLLRKALSFST